MPHITPFLFTVTEIAAVLLREKDIHEGHWGVCVNFGFQAANVPLAQGDSIYPAALVYLMEIGIQQFPEPNSMTVDAAKVNPQSELSPRLHSSLH